MDLLQWQQTDKNQFAVFIRDLSINLNNVKHMIEDTTKQINNVKSRQNNVVTNSTMALPAAQVPNPIKSQTRVKFNGEYQYADDSSNVPIGTLLHTHLDNTTMTSHSTQTPMGDTSRVVIRSNITNENTRAANVRVRRTPKNGNQTRTTTNTSRVTTGRTTPPTPRSGGGGMSGGGGGGY